MSYCRAEQKKTPYTPVKVDLKKKGATDLLNLHVISDHLYVFSQPFVLSRGVCLEDDLQFSAAEDFLKSHHVCGANLLSLHSLRRGFPSLLQESRRYSSLSNGHTRAWSSLHK